MQHHIVAEERELDVRTSALELNLDVAEARVAAAQGGEKFRIDQQFALLANAGLHALTELRASQRIRRLKQLHGSVEDLKQREATQVTDEYRAARLHGLDGCVEHGHEVIEIGKVLGNRVQHYGGELARMALTIEFMGRFALQRRVRHFAAGPLQW